MRVCMFVKNSFEYDARVTKEARTLTEAGHVVTVVALHVPGVTARREERADGVNVVRVPRPHERVARLRGPSTTAAGAPARGGAGVRGALRAVEPLAAPVVRAVTTAILDRRMVAAGRQTEADVFHAHDLNTLRVAVRCARSSGADVVYDAHELQTQRDGMGVVRRAWSSAVERSGIAHAAAVITATDTWADYLAGLYGVSRPTVVRNVPYFQEPEPERSLRDHFGIPPNVTVLLYQGSIQAHRGIEQSIVALDLLPDSELVVIGYGAHRPVLERLAASRGVADRVHFPGPVPNDELIGWTAGADIGLCCIANTSLSYYTSLPNKVFEYAMAGVPSVTSDFPEMGRLVRDEGIGEVCDPEDPRSIAAAVERLRQPARREETRRHAREAARRHHWETEQDRLLQVYGRLEGIEADGEPPH